MLFYKICAKEAIKNWKEIIITKNFDAEKWVATRIK